MPPTLTTEDDTYAEFEKLAEMAGYPSAEAFIVEVFSAQTPDALGPGDLRPCRLTRGTVPKTIPIDDDLHKRIQQMVTLVGYGVPRTSAPTTSSAASRRRSTSTATKKKTCGRCWYSWGTYREFYIATTRSILYRTLLKSAVELTE